jgi:hypothetical protein
MLKTNRIFITATRLHVATCTSRRILSSGRAFSKNHFICFEAKDALEPLERRIGPWSYRIDPSAACLSVRLVLEDRRYKTTDNRFVRNHHGCPGVSLS